MIRDKYITKERFVKYLKELTDDKYKIAHSCNLTDFGRHIVAYNLFNKEWTGEGEFVEVHTRNGGLKKIKKYKSWAESMEDFNDPIENTGLLDGIIKLYL